MSIGVSIFKGNIMHKIAAFFCWKRHVYGLAVRWYNNLCSSTEKENGYDTAKDNAEDFLMNDRREYDIENAAYYVKKIR